jgi:hypothetical protein
MSILKITDVNPFSFVLLKKRNSEMASTDILPASFANPSFEQYIDWYFASKSNSREAEAPGSDSSPI